MDLARAGFRTTEANRFIELFEAEAAYNERDHRIIRAGVGHLFQSAERDASRGSLMALILSYFVTIGTLVLAALLALDRYRGESLFWTSWSLSLTIVIANKILYTSGAERRAIVGAAIAAKYASEGRVFLASAGRYRGMPPADALLLFIERIEKIAGIANRGGNKSADEMMQDIDAAAGISRRSTRNSHELVPLRDPTHSAV